MCAVPLSQVLCCKCDSKQAVHCRLEAPGFLAGSIVVGLVIWGESLSARAGRRRWPLLTSAMQAWVPGGLSSGCSVRPCGGAQPGSACRTGASSSRCASSASPSLCCDSAAACEQDLCCRLPSKPGQQPTWRAPCPPWCSGELWALQAMLPAHCLASLQRHARHVGTAMVGGCCLLWLGVAAGTLWVCVLDAEQLLGGPGLEPLKQTDLEP